MISLNVILHWKKALSFHKAGDKYGRSVCSATGCGIFLQCLSDIVKVDIIKITLIRATASKGSYAIAPTNFFWHVPGSTMLPKIFVIKALLLQVHLNKSLGHLHLLQIITHKLFNIIDIKPYNTEPWSIQWRQDLSKTKGGWYISTLENCDICRFQGVSQERKKFSVLHEFGIKTQLGVWGHCESLSGFSGEPGGKTLGKFTIFSLKLVWYSLLEIIKLQLSNKKLLL